MYKIRLDSWVIQDGNYTNFTCGETINFAVHFQPNNLDISSSNNKGLSNLSDTIYRANGQVVFINEKVIVIDFGIYTYCENNALGFKVGDFVSGEIILEIDCFSYRDYYSKIDQTPSISYSWTINKITRVIGNDITSGINRDLQYTDVKTTNAWTDDDGNASYILHCTLNDLTR